MSWTDKEIDDLAKESAGNSSFDFKNEYWTEFEAMLPKGGGKGFAWFFTAFLFIGLLTTSVVFNETLRSDESKIVAQQKNESLTVLDKETNLEKTQSTIDISTKSETTSELQSALQKPTTNKSVVDAHNSSNKKATYSTATSNTIKKQFIDPTVLNMMLGKELVESKINKEAENFNDTNEKGIERTNKADSADASSLENNVNEIPETNERKLLSVSETSDIESISNLPLLTLKESVSAELQPLTLHNERELPAIVTFYVSAFGGLSESLITPSKDVTSSFGLGLGAQIQKGRFTFTTGVNGVWSNHKDLNLTRSAKIYGFGSEQYNYEFKYKQIYTLEAELSAGYKLGRHLISVGVRPSVIIGTKVGVNESMDDKSTIDRNEYGYVNGLNRFGVKPMIGYAFDVTNSLKIGVNIGVEMMSKIQGNFLEGNSNRFPIDGQIYLRHSIKFKK